MDNRELKAKCVGFALRIIESGQTGTYSGSVPEIADSIAEAAKKLEEYIKA